MHLLRLGEVRMRSRSGASAPSSSGDDGALPKSAFSSEKGAGEMNIFAKSSRKTSTSSSTHNSSRFYIYALAVVIIYAFSSYSDMYGVSAMPRCTPCPGGECPDPPEGTCSYGIVTNYCGRRVCAKGPGEVCGTGMFKMLGSCGDGMYCHCGRCIGCSIFTLECFDKTCTK